MHLDTKFNPHRFHFLWTLPNEALHFGYDPIVCVLSLTDRSNSLSFESPCKWIIGKLTCCSIQWATVNNFQSCSVWPISCRPMGRPRCERVVGTVTAGKPVADKVWRSCTVNTPNTHLQDLFWLRKDQKKMNELWFCSLVHWSIKAQLPICLCCLRKNPAVLKGSHLAGGHMPFLVVVTTQNSLTDLSKVNSHVKSGDTNHICTGKPDKPSRTCKGCGTLWNLLGIKWSDFSLKSTSCAYLLCWQVGWRHPPEHCVFGCLPVWSQSSVLHRSALWVSGEHLRQSGTRF